MPKPPRVPLVPHRTKRLQQTSYPDAKDLDKLSSSEQENYTKDVQFRRTIEAIEDRIIGPDGEPGIFKGGISDIFRAWNALTDQQRGNRVQSNESVLNSTRTNTRKYINLYIDQHNVRNGWGSELVTYPQNQTAPAKQLLTFINQLEEFDPDSPDDLVEGMARMGLKFADMNKTDINNWKKEVQERESE